MRYLHMAVIIIMTVLTPSGAAVLAASPVSLRIYPGAMAGFEPVTVRVTTLIDPHPDNRQACLIWDSDEGMAGSSCWELDGESARTRVHELRGLSAGEYVVVLRVARTGEKVLEARGGFRVEPRG